MAVTHWGMSSEVFLVPRGHHAGLVSPGSQGTLPRQRYTFHLVGFGSGARALSNSGNRPRLCIMADSDEDDTQPSI